ncbi:MAG TPA: TIR domain-containing protein [Nitrospira sp.]|nr:TIR domain-containing protein [Nitrospira sp.]
MSTNLSNSHVPNPLVHDIGTPRYFISYDHADHANVEKIRRGIQRGPQRFAVWFDRRDLRAGSLIDPTIQQAIDICSTILFVATTNSVKSEYCQAELDRGFRKNKTIVSLCIDSNIDLPLRLSIRKFIDFSSSFEDGLNELHDFLVQDQEESQLPPVTTEPVVPTATSPGEIQPIVINKPTTRGSVHFVGRTEQCRLIEGFLSDDASSVLWIWGRSGSGKTALTCHVLDEIQRGKWTDSGRMVPIHAVSYLNQNHHSLPDWLNLLDKIRKSIPPVPGLTPREKSLASTIAHLLSGLSDHRVVLLVDHLDELIDLKTRKLTDPNLRDALQTVLTLTNHKLKVIGTSQIVPDDLPTDLLGRWDSRNLGGGLPRSEAIQLLERLAQDSSLGLQGDDKLLNELCRFTQCNPRAIETIHAVLKTNPLISPRDILRDENLPYLDDVFNALIGESYACLDEDSKAMMRVLSSSDTPVRAEVVVKTFRYDYPDIDARQVLDQLTVMQLVEKTNEGYLLQETDRRYVASQVSDCNQQDVLAGDPTTEAASLILLFNHLHKQKNYPDAVNVLTQLEPHLNQLGRYQELTECYKKLDGYFEELARKPENSDLVCRHLDRFAGIYHRLGRLDDAADYYEKGLECALNVSDRRRERRYLGNLALCMQESGDLVGSALYCMAALELARQTKDEAWEAHIWNILSDSWAGLGKISDAMRASEQALTLARENDQRESEVVALVNLGQQLEAQGYDHKAEGKCKQACEIAKDIGFQLGESAARRNLGILNLNGEKYIFAVEHLTKAIELADATQNRQLQQTTRIELATAYLLTAKLEDGEKIVNEAVQFNTPLFSPEAHSLRGIILYRLEKNSEAAKAFLKARNQAELVFNQTSAYYRALDTMGLSYCGLTLSLNEPYLDEAIIAYGAAHSLTHEPGIVRRRLLLFDALAKTDSEKKLVSVRKTIDPKGKSTITR